ncbi:uncharacterized protein MELLADRAFT_102860 [Melampsora larici-populina 98AG31]|uniref:RING-type domain-containing protein n=1 Tax=Melampsora larici-populina (strain 98AG31 / pathotype 3-4-7) TaxID=747676 RepID=F4R9M4_MELLP|nr:uncharacterized protein MELLADRAFT_102860 [Melampsora larici-populina 98AG31]EGG11005.1 hypothetical protein MELLADRAFT_102860 [Melampsora larici-populina 98AG31]
MAQSIPRTLSYSELLKIIQTFQSDIDHLNTPHIKPEDRILPCLILYMCFSEAIMLEIEARGIWDKNEIHTWRRELETNGFVLDQIIKISQFVDVDMPLVHFLPPPGSEEWWGLYIFSRLLVQCSRVYIPEPRDNGGKKPDCPICGEDFMAGERYVQLPCHPTHWLHETCLTDFAAHTLEISCPLGRCTFWL